MPRWRTQEGFLTETDALGNSSNSPRSVYCANATYRLTKGGCVTTGTFVDDLATQHAKMLVFMASISLELAAKFV